MIIVLNVAEAMWPAFAEVVFVPLPDISPDCLRSRRLYQSYRLHSHESYWFFVIVEKSFYDTYNLQTSWASALYEGNFTVVSRVSLCDVGDLWLDSELD